MKCSLSEAEANAFIASIPDQAEVDWVEDEKKRKSEYRQIILRGDRRELVSLIKALHSHAKKQKSIGKKVHACDEKLSKEAERLLYEEFASALKMDKESVFLYIASKIGTSGIDA